MKNARIALASLLMGLFSSAALAAPTTYIFDTLSAVSMDATVPSVSGVLHNQTATTTVSFTDNTNISFRFIVNRCVPIFLTMIEKPGRYWLSVTVDPAQSNVQLVSCTLTVRS